MTPRPNFLRCYDRRYLLELVPSMLALSIAVILAFAVPRTLASRLSAVGLACASAACVIVVTVAAIRRLDERQQRLHLIAIAIAFAATGVVASMQPLFEKLGVNDYPSGLTLWMFMYFVWSIALVALQHRYR